MVNRKSHIYAKRLRSEKCEQRFIKPRVQGGYGSLGIWGCISHHGAGVSQSYQGRIDQFRYQNVLEYCLFPSVDLLYGREDAWYFMQDGAKPHTAKSTMQFLQDH